MVVVTKIPDVEASSQELLKEHLKTESASPLVINKEDFPLKVSVNQPNEEINTTIDYNNIPRGLKTCKQLIRKSILEKNKTLLKESCIGLISELSVLTVLEIYSFLNDVSPFNDEPSAPPTSEIDHDWTMIFQKSIAKCQEECDKIINEKTYDIFTNIDDVMKLSYRDLLGILKRTTLNVSDEEFLYEIMYEWAERRSSNHKDFQRILGDLPHHIRFGTMKPKTFKKLKGIKDVLDQKDIRIIRFYLEEKTKGRETHTLPHQWSNPRITSNDCNTRVGRNKRLERAGMYCLICWMFVFD
nr:uncharacterized protein LOC111426985 [Onthophagus taurus]